MTDSSDSKFLMNYEIYKAIGDSADKRVPTPEYKLGSLIAKHRADIINFANELDHLAANVVHFAETDKDSQLHELLRHCDRATNSIRSRLLQIKAAKETGTVMGIKPGIWVGNAITSGNKNV